jgi:GH15 family glucan-1,4-alpha-glucosidase
VSSRIEDYGLIGDCETAGLVGRDGSIDWLCWPAFDSDACFAALLGTREHGRWQIAPSGDIEKCSRRYRGDTLILETRFEVADGIVTLIDFMPPRGKASDVVRLVRGEGGRVKMRMELIIRFGFGRDIPWVRRSEEGALLAICGPDMTVLRTPVETRGEHMTTVADFDVGAGETIPFVLTYGPSHLRLPEPIDPEQALQDTEDFWSEWSGRCTYEGERRDLVMRSLITLKALTYAPTGGIVAAPTTSLPEKLGGARNWDYRFCWLRDATFTLLALMNSGYTEEASAWHNWLLRSVAAPAGMGGGLAAGLWRRATGPRRQCGACAVAARCLWRVDRRVSPIADGRIEAGRQLMGAGVQGAGASRRGLGQAGSRCLGEARRGQALRLIQGDDLGGFRPCDQECREIRSGRTARPMEAAARRHLPGCLRQGL